eukprot:jgi/Galph1/1820/GphlegSOOS_G481.1
MSKYHYHLSAAQWTIVFVFISAVAVILIVTGFIRSVLRWKNIRIVKDSVFYTDSYYLKSLPKTARKLLLSEAERERHLRIVPEVPVDFGWGLPGSEFEGIHFKTSVAKSYLVIEQAVKTRMPHRVIKPDMTVFDYIMEIQQSFPNLSRSTCEQYIDFYERACFTKEQFTSSEYRRFVNIILHLIQSIESFPLPCR